MTHQVGFQFVLAARLVLAAVVALGWRRAVGLNVADPPRCWRVVRLPKLVIGGFMLGAVLVGVPPAQTIVGVLITTLLVGVSEDLMIRGTVVVRARTIAVTDRTRPRHRATGLTLSDAGRHVLVKGEPSWCHVPAPLCVCSSC